MLNKTVLVDASQYQFTGVPEKIVKAESRNSSCELTDSGKVTCKDTTQMRECYLGKKIRHSHTVQMLLKSTV